MLTTKDIRGVNSSIVISLHERTFCTDVDIVGQRNSQLPRSLAQAFSTRPDITMSSCITVIDYALTKWKKPSSSVMEHYRVSPRYPYAKNLIRR